MALCPGEQHDDHTRWQQLTTKRLFADSKYSDLTIECEGRKWMVHRNIICPQCEYFEKICDGLFKACSSLNKRSRSS